MGIVSSFLLIFSAFQLSAVAGPVSEKELARHKLAAKMYDQALTLEKEGKYNKAEELLLELIERFPNQKVLHPWADGYHQEDHFGEVTTFKKEAEEHLGFLRCRRFKATDGSIYKESKILLDEIVSALKDVSKNRIKALLDCRTVRSADGSTYDPPETPERHLKWLVDQRLLLGEKKLEFKELKRIGNKNRAMMSLYGFRDHKELIIEILNEGKRGWIWFAIIENVSKEVFPKEFPEQFSKKK